MTEQGTGEWNYSKKHDQPCQILEKLTLWGQDVCRVWLPQSGSVELIEAKDLGTTSASQLYSADHISYIVSAARIAEALETDLMLSPLEADIIPLPHQLSALYRALGQRQVRYLLADEVGLGKTIEAGLIFRELKLRKRVRRILVICPKSLILQWVAEMQQRFKESFYIFSPSYIGQMKQANPTINPWQTYNQVICSMDMVKPFDRRIGWTSEQFEKYNQERFADLVSAGWDLIIIDEAHHLAGSTEQVARYKLGRGLAEASPYLLLLTATPHSGKSDAFCRLMSLINEKAFPSQASINQQKIQPYLIRTEKRHAIDGEGLTLFKPRITQLITIFWKSKHSEQQLLYEEITKYVQREYPEAIKEKKNYVGFFLLLLQRLVTSSTKALITSLEKRLLTIDNNGDDVDLMPKSSEEDVREMDGQEQVDLLADSYIAGIADERSILEALLDKAKMCVSLGPDAKAEALVGCIYNLMRQQTDPELKVLIFTEFIATQEMLHEFLTARGFGVVCLNGTMNMEERQKAQNDFAEKARILIATDTGGEGINLQFCHVVVNYDLPWNPMRIEQRIGRVDRIGQEHTVQALNFVFADTIELRVREVLEEKLETIAEEFGIDKTSDVLDSPEAGRIFDDLFIKALTDPRKLEDALEESAKQFESIGRKAKDITSLFSTTTSLNTNLTDQLRLHPLPYWTERMITAYLRSHGGRAEVHGQRWELTWSDGEKYEHVTFHHKEQEVPITYKISVSDPKVYQLIAHLSRFSPYQCIPIIHLKDIPDDLTGIWSLWQISAMTQDGKQSRFMPLFIHDDNRILALAAKTIWDKLLSHEIVTNGYMEKGLTEQVFNRSQKAAEQQGQDLFTEILSKHRAWLQEERQRGEEGFAARKTALMRIGLDAVRKHRLTELEKERKFWEERLNKNLLILPDLQPLMFCQIRPTAE